MTKEEILEVMRECMPEEKEITDDMSIFGDLGLDSLLFIRFIAKIEELTGVEFEDMEPLFDRLEHIGELCNYILEKAGE